MVKINKFLYGWKLLVNYGFGHGWEFECFKETYIGYKENKRLYRENCDYPQKWVNTREPNPKFKKIV